MRLQGIGIGRGAVLGPVLRMPEPLPEPSDQPRTADASEENLRAMAALRATSEDLRSRADRVGGETKDVLDAQALMAQDPTLLEDVRSRIDGGRTAERAVFEAFNTFQQMLLSMGGYMAERAADLGDLAQRAIAHLLGVTVPGIPESDAPYILLAHDLAPADTAMLDLTKVLGLITITGGPTSHTAILARSQAITAVVGVAAAALLENGTEVLVDATEGTVTVSPSEKAIAAAMRRRDRRTAKVPIGPGALADDTPIQLLANLGSVEDAAQALALGAEGVGLFRTELLYLGATQAPSVAEQTETYGRLLAQFPGKKVVVRTLDAGADKPLAFLAQGTEANPALGQRGIRAAMANERILRDQLLALSQAGRAHDAQLWVMAPMIADVTETAYFVRLAREYDLPVAGVMAEVPSSALLAAQILGVADFISIGTNDLTQYTLAADRMLGSVAAYQDPWHPAVLRLIKMLGDAGAWSGRPVSVCGEAAADPLLAVVLVGLGATSLSMSPAALDDVRTELRQHTLEHAKALAQATLACSSAAEARAIMLEA